ncbi:hypothetical protein RND71_012875 [Anisodus tanguticus]|uniref:Uncharacterized protein n=1 Tax=Anisodus tanguticus TaxID=243964 RepID=A0AAE1VGH0_9SOLA|nr:hypothetical protein RND71_012875 [Anisodus tanguticus]
MAKIYQIASVLYDVLRTVVPSSKVEDQIKAALRAIRNMDNLPILRMPDDKDKSVNDILEWLASAFGFQKANVANQREHLILLLANMDIRNRSVEDDANYNEMAHEMHGILFGNVLPVSGGAYQPVSHGEGLSCGMLWPLFMKSFAMVIIAWNQSGSLAVIFDADVFKSVLSIFITAAILNALRATLDIVLSLRAWRSLKFTQILRYLLKFTFAAFCVVVMPVAYSKSVQDPAGVLRFFSNLGSVIENESLYYYCVAIYLIPEILAAFLFFFPFLRKSMECSNWRIISLLMWCAQVHSLLDHAPHKRSHSTTMLRSMRRNSRFRGEYQSRRKEHTDR